MSRLQRTESLLAVIDVQDKLLPVIHNAEAVEQNIERLVRGFHVMDIPIVVTEQYVKGLGPTVPRVHTALAETVGYSTIEKTTFSAAGSGEFQSAMRMARRKQIVVAGVEAHVCVYQTVTDLLAADYQVTIVADAVSSRTVENRDLALRRMVADGARLASTEMVLFELLGKAGTEEFREVLSLIK
jgi:isochorismate hydrolase